MNAVSAERLEYNAKLQELQATVNKLNADKDQNQTRLQELQVMVNKHKADEDMSQAKLEELQAVVNKQNADLQSLQEDLHLEQPFPAPASFEFCLKQCRRDGRNGDSRQSFFWQSHSCPTLLCRACRMLMGGSWMRQGEVHIQTDDAVQWGPV